MSIALLCWPWRHHGAQREGISQNKSSTGNSYSSKSSWKQTWDIGMGFERQRRRRDKSQGRRHYSHTLSSKGRSCISPHGNLTQNKPQLAISLHFSWCMSYIILKAVFFLLSFPIFLNRLKLSLEYFSASEYFNILYCSLQMKCH